MPIKTVNNILVLVIIIFSLIVSVYGFFSNKIIYENKSIQTISGENVMLYGKGLYHNDSVSGASQARAQDIITLIVGLPLLIISLLLSNKNSLRGKLLLTGTIGYFLYTYASYSFLLSYNAFFLIYVLLMSLSFFCFVINITSDELKNLDRYFGQNFPKKYIGIFTIIIGAIVLLMWLALILPSMKTAPAELEHYTTLVIQALDIGFIAPVAILSGIMLIKNKSQGYLLASIIIIKGATLLLAVSMMIVFMISSGVNVPIIQIIIFPIFAIMCVLNLFMILKNVVEKRRQTSA